MEPDRKRTLAREALGFTRLRLQEKLPFLTEAMAIPALEWTEDASGTDGERLYWKAEEVCRWYGSAPELLERQYLHLLLHGLYLHGFRQVSCPGRIWDLACDLMTEYRIDRMDVPGFPRPVPPERSRSYRKIREAGAVFREKEIARWLSGQEEQALSELERVFRRDNHGFWKNRQESREEDRGPHRERLPLEELEARMNAVHRWRTVYEELEQRAEEHRRQAGGSAGAQSQAIVLEQERGHDYRKFLKRFAVTREEMCLDTDSFDYIPYDYSRRMYERLVFLEPLEYKEMQKLEELVIAIDTSGSCSGEIVRQFLQETWEILSEKENFFRKFHICLIQCDCLIQECIHITCEEQWKDYLEHMEVKGHGDTDFTPVFRLVDRLVEEGELKGLRGLLYFTDGDGIYPSEKPEYDTAFVFLNEELQKGKAPDWALTLTLDKELETSA